jgi:restriction endonuclease S subunit
VQNGYAFDSRAFSSTIGVPLIRIRDLKNGMNTEARYRGPYDDRYLVNAGDLLIGMDGEFGCYEWAGASALLNQRVCRLQGFSERLLPRFLLYGLNGHLKAIEDVTGYATVKHLSSKQVLGIEFPVPPIADQQRVVRLLDQAFRSIAIGREKTAQSLLGARDLFGRQIDARFAEINRTADAYENLGELTEPGSPITYGVVKPGPEGEVPFVRGGDLQNGKISLDRLRTISGEISRQYRRTLLRGGELLICLVGQPGQVAVAPEALAGANIARQVGLIRLQPHVGAEFVRLYLQSSLGRQALGARQSGSVQQVINLGELRQVLIPIVSRKRRQELVDVLALA